MRISFLTAKNVVSSNVQQTNTQNHVYLRPLQLDSVNFGKRNIERDPRLLSAEEGAKAAAKFRTSTSGYRDDSVKGTFNDALVYSMTNAAIQYALDNKQNVIYIGGDTRKATRKYIPVIADIFRRKGFDVYLPKVSNYKGYKKTEASPVATPVLALVAKKTGLPLSILMTASHNPWDDGGYNFLMGSGAVADNTVVEPLADNLANITKRGKVKPDADKYGEITFYDPYSVYKKYLDTTKLVDFANIKKAVDAGLAINYDGLQGTGAYYFPRLMEDNGIKLNTVLSSKTPGPEPKAEYLKNLSEAVKNTDSKLRIGLANDGDADRFGVVDENGNFVSANNVILLTAYHLIKNKGMKKGTVIINVSTSDKIKDLINYFNQKEGTDIQFVRTPVGFKYLGGKMEELENTEYPVIVAGEESGGLTIRDHIPEKDGLVAVSTILDLVASEGRNIGEILQDINQNIIGKNYVGKSDAVSFPKTEEGFALQNKALHAFDRYFDGTEYSMAGLAIDKLRTSAEDANIRTFKPDGDGLKIFFKDGSSLLVRKSGTEPKLRLITEGTSRESFDTISEFAKETANSVAK